MVSSTSPQIMVAGCLEALGSLSLEVDSSNIPKNTPRSITVASFSCFTSKFEKVEVVDINGGCNNPTVINESYSNNALIVTFELSESQVCGGNRLALSLL